MKSILKIHKPENSVHILWEHLIKSALAFTGTFAMLFFGPLLIAGKTQSKIHHDSDSDPMLGFIRYLIEHPEVQIGLCIIAVIIYNLFIVSKNSKKKYAVSIDLEDNKISIGKTNLYYKVIENVSLPLENLAYEIQTKTSDAGEKQSTLKFIDKSDHSTIALIKPSHTIWSDQIKDIRSSLKELDSLGVNRNEHNSTYTSVLGSLFKR